MNLKIWFFLAIISYCAVEFRGIGDEKIWVWKAFGKICENCSGNTHFYLMYTYMPCGLSALFITVQWILFGLKNVPRFVSLLAPTWKMV